ncbi:hypothetical protein QE152_g5393 [Popillia japonica]|uniref:Uncharacterized protein n=1 Tax=Popillia japonica TaxID=7064 RepID=A0AAW1MPU2_POPJA
MAISRTQLVEVFQLYYGLKINEGKTKYMRIGADITNVISNFNCTSKSYSFEEVQQFDYVEVTATLIAPVNHILLKKYNSSITWKSPLAEIKGRGEINKYIV